MNQMPGRHKTFPCNELFLCNKVGVKRDSFNIFTSWQPEKLHKLYFFSRKGDNSNKKMYKMKCTELEKVFQVNVSIFTVGLNEILFFIKAFKEVQ